MMHFLPFVPATPLLSAIVLMLFGAHLPRRVSACLGAGSVGLAFVLAAVASLGLHFSDVDAFRLVLWRWVGPAELGANMAFHLDALSVLMMLVVTGVGFLIHVYSIEYMAEDRDFARFFACMNLFIAAMLVLVLADNLLLLFLGWEGVGLCSYLLIGFWYRDPANTAAATKAFLVTRIGDAALAGGVFLLVWTFGTFHLQTLLERAPGVWTTGAWAASAAALLLLGGALGKSGQLPLQVWLPDAMAGPTPVSALIHAATMVTGGVYLIARMHVLYELAPGVLRLVAIIGALTLLLAGCAAIAQRDLKRALAYSTISQVGYMFLALGVGAWSAAMFHFMTHAFFKALLFMSAGWIIVSLHHKQDIFEMGGLRREMPTAFWSFVVGSASLMALPLVTSGFYSKDAILWEALTSPHGAWWLWLAGVVGAFLTAVYTARLVLRVFFGQQRSHVEHQPGNLMRVPLIVLAILSSFAGFLEIPRTLGGWQGFSHFMASALGSAEHGEHSVALELAVQFLTLLVVAVGAYAAYFSFTRRVEIAGKLGQEGAFRSFYSLWSSGWGFDALYDWLIVRPFVYLSRRFRNDPVEDVYGLVLGANQEAASFLSGIQTGRLRWYMLGVAFGAVLTIAVVVFS